MNILSTNKSYNQPFCSKNIIAYDDEISKKRRDYIRFHYDSWHNPSGDIFEREPRLEEFELKKLINTYAKKPQKIIPEEIPVIAKRIDSSRLTSNYRGSTLRYSPDSTLIAMKKAGFKTIIDLAGFKKDYKQKVENTGLKFLNFNIEPFMNLLSYASPESSKEVRPFIDNFIGFIKTMQEGNAYLACDYGTYRTDDAVALNSFFNPIAKRHPTRVRSYKQIEQIKHLYNNLTSSDKLKIKWDENYEKQFLQMLKKSTTNMI